MLNIILDGLFILNEYKAGIIVFFICAFGLGFVQLKLLTRGRPDPTLSLLISFSIGCINLALISYILVIFGYIWQPALKVGSFVIPSFIIIIFIYNIWPGGIRKAFNNQIAIIASYTFLFLLLRLAFLKYLIVPPYSDSPIHYQVILGILNPKNNYNFKLSLENIFSNYYHFGFHSLAAWLATATNLAPVKIMPLLGQLFLVLAPLSVAGWTFAASNNLEGAFFAGLLAATGWLMPAFSANWGKYPALMAIVLFPVVLTLPWLYQHNKDKKSNFLFHGLILLAGITLIHTRIVICLLLAGISFFISGKLQPKEEMSFFQSIRFSILFAISLWPLLRFLSEFYTEALIWLVLLFLLPFSFQSYTRVTTGIFFYIFGLWVVTFFPGILNVNVEPLLDRQFVEMMLYIPFSIVGGMGFAALIKNIDSNNALKWTTTFFLVGIVVFNFHKNGSFYPDSCCNYFTADDQLAIDWIRENKSPHLLFIIPAFNNNGKIFGTDAGMWIYPLTNVSINKLPFNTQWDSGGIFSEICNADLTRTYIYASGNDFSFDKSKLIKETWLQPVFNVGQVSIYKVDSCKK